MNYERKEKPHKDMNEGTTDGTEGSTEAADVVWDYINFFVDTNVPTKTIKSYPNNKPWMNKDVQNKIQKNNI